MKAFAIKTLFFSLTLALGAACTSNEGELGETGPTTAETAKALEGTMGLQWNLITVENCGDIFMRACTSSFPSPQCPGTSPAGKVCPQLGRVCFETRPGGVEYEEYQCESTIP